MVEGSRVWLITALWMGTWVAAVVQIDVTTVDEDQALSELQEELHAVGVDHAAEEDHEVLSRGAVADVVCGVLVDTIHDELSDVVHTGSGTSAVLEAVLVDTIHDELSDVVHTGSGPSTVLEASSVQEVLVDNGSHGLDGVSNVAGRVSWDKTGVLMDTVHEELSDVVPTGGGIVTALEADSIEKVLVDRDPHGLEEASHVVGRASWDVVWGVLMDIVLVDTIHDELSNVVHTRGGASIVLEADIVLEALIGEDSHGLGEASHVAESVSWMSGVEVVHGVVEVSTTELIIELCTDKLGVVSGIITEISA
ncbi:hypothetical protein Q9L58_001981 [Maublancomyces gigas]|uniref:Uncharacterized protein n=1 Tax=Discina gigas TaxID=1032678 RepID=A0ABR3GSM3_9PEZI